MISTKNKIAILGLGNISFELCSSLISRGFIVSGTTNNFERKHKLIRGDVSKTVPQFFQDEPHTVVALAYFDLALYEPSKTCFETLRPHLIRGSVVALDEINNPAYPGETVALKETWGLNFGRIIKSKYMPGRAYLIVD